MYVVHIYSHRFTLIHKNKQNSIFSCAESYTGQWKFKSEQITTTLLVTRLLKPNLGRTFPYGIGVTVTSGMTLVTGLKGERSNLREMVPDGRSSTSRNQTLFHPKENPRCLTPNPTASQTIQIWPWRESKRARQEATQPGSKNFPRLCSAWAQLCLPSTFTIGEK